MALGYVAAAAADTRLRAPWSEPLHFHCEVGELGDGKAKRLWGEANIHVVAYEDDHHRYRDVTPADDAVMAYDEAKHLLELLAARTATDGAAWEVALGKVSGRVGAGRLQPGAREILAELARRAGRPISATGELPEVPASERAALSARYPERH